jgi:tripartite-type tricarboxylate transporter receptor subunit TctC
MRRLLMAAMALVLTLADAHGAELTHILVGFPPGQATDIVARLLADRLAPLLGETVIVENRPGQGGSIALASLSQSAADGHTMVLAPLASLVVNPHMYKTVGYDTFKDLAPVALVADLPLLLVVNPSLPINSVPELIAYAKANPDRLAHPSSGNGTLSHLAMDTVTVTEPFIRAGKMRLLASAYSERVPSFPNTPTLAEQGFPEINLSAWLGIVVASATPKPRIDQLGAAINKVMQMPEIAEKFVNLGAIPRAMGPKEFGAFLASEDARWSAVVKSSGIKIE